MQKGVILKSVSVEYPYTLKFYFKDIKEIKDYCKKHNIKYVDNSTPNF